MRPLQPTTPDPEPALQGSELDTQTPAGRRSSGLEPPPAPGGQPDSTPPVIPSHAAAARALCDYFLANADRGDHAANDQLVAEVVRRIRSLQATDHHEPDR